MCCRRHLVLSTRERVFMSDPISFPQRPRAAREDLFKANRPQGDHAMGQVERRVDVTRIEDLVRDLRIACEDFVLCRLRLKLTRHDAAPSSGFDHDPS